MVCAKDGMSQRVVADFEGRAGSGNREWDESRRGLDRGRDFVSLAGLVEMVVGC